MLNKINCYCSSYLLPINGKILVCSQESLGRRNGSTARAPAQSILLGLEHKVGKRIKTQEGKLRQKPGFYGSTKMIEVERKKTQLRMSLKIYLQ